MRGKEVELGFSMEFCAFGIAPRVCLLGHAVDGTGTCAFLARRCLKSPGLSEGKGIEGLRTLAAMEKLLKLVYEHDLKSWSDEAKNAFEELFGGAGRYPERARKAVQIRAPKFTEEENVPFATLIEPTQAQDRMAA